MIQDEARVREILKAVKPLASEYYHLTGKPPILAERVKYYQDREFAGLFDKPPLTTL